MTEQVTKDDLRTVHDLAMHGYRTTLGLENSIKNLSGAPKERLALDPRAYAEQYISPFLETANGLLKHNKRDAAFQAFAAARIQHRLGSARFRNVEAACAHELVVRIAFLFMRLWNRSFGLPETGSRSEVESAQLFVFPCADPLETQAGKERFFRDAGTIFSDFNPSIMVHYSKNTS